MNINLELIDEMRKRTNCSYEEAMELLQKNNGDLLNAIVDFEKKQRSGFSGKQQEHGSGFVNKIKALIYKGFKTRFLIMKNENTILNISVNILILSVLITLPSSMWFLPIAVVIAYFNGYKISIRKEQGESIDINEMVAGVENKIKTTTDENSQNSRANSWVVKNQDNKSTDNYNEITIE